jgi:hypothetical protein
VSPPLVILSCGDGPLRLMRDSVGEVAWTVREGWRKRPAADRTLYLRKIDNFLTIRD